MARVKAAVEKAQAEDQALESAVSYIQQAWARFVDTGDQVPSGLVVRRWVIWADYDVSKVRDAVLHAAHLSDDEMWDFDTGIADVDQYLCPVDNSSK